MKLSFLEGVYSQRADKLTIDRETLAGGEIYMGLQALQIGLIDELGSGKEALAKAAQLAHLAHYQTIDVNDAVYGKEPPEELAHYRQLLRLASKNSAWRQELYYLYVEPERRAR
jgi:ClpP class serine protease